MMPAPASPRAQTRRSPRYAPQIDVTTASPQLVSKPSSVSVRAPIQPAVRTPPATASVSPALHSPRRRSGAASAPATSPSSPSTSRIGATAVAASARRAARSSARSPPLPPIDSSTGSASRGRRVASTGVRSATAARTWAAISGTRSAGRGSEESKIPRWKARTPAPNSALNHGPEATSAAAASSAGRSVTSPGDRSTTPSVKRAAISASTSSWASAGPPGRRSRRDRGSPSRRIARGPPPRSSRRSRSGARERQSCPCCNARPAGAPDAGQTARIRADLSSEPCSAYC